MPSPAARPDPQLARTSRVSIAWQNPRASPAGGDVYTPCGSVDFELPAFTIPTRLFPGTPAEHGGAEVSG